MNFIYSSLSDYDSNWGWVPCSTGVPPVWGSSHKCRSLTFSCPPPPYAQIGGLTLLTDLEIVGAPSLAGTLPTEVSFSSLWWMLAGLHCGVCEE